MRGGAHRAGGDVRTPGKHSDWRAIVGLQARIAALFIPVVVAFALLAAFAGSQRDPGVDATVTSSVR